MRWNPLRTLFATTHESAASKRSRRHLSVETLEGKALMAYSAFAGVRAAAIVAKAAPTVEAADAYVTGVFNTVLYRDPTEAELSKLATPLSAGKTTYAKVAAVVLNSRENLGNIVTNSYYSILNRAPGTAELNNGISLLSKKTGTESQLQARLFSSKEYLTLYSVKNPTQFVSSVAATYGVTYSDSALAANSPNVVKKGLYQGALTVLSSAQVMHSRLAFTYYSILGEEPTPSALASLAHASSTRFGGQISLLSSQAFIQSTQIVVE
ncbi:hypothetical protein EP7_000694 [Isosphaeraceae bacterium EP7]